MIFEKSKFADNADKESQKTAQEILLYRTLIAGHVAALASLISFFIIHPDVFNRMPMSFIHAAVGGLLFFDSLFFYRALKNLMTRKETEQSWDSVTGSWTFSYFEHKLQEEAQRAGRYRYALTLCAIDLDHFRSFNENFGPKRGDELLKQFAILMQGHIRTTDLFARSQDDTFFLLFPHTDMIRSERVTARLLEQAGEDLNCQFRAGLAAFHCGDHAAQLIQRAKTALALAKREGSHRIQCVVADAQAETLTTVEL